MFESSSRSPEPTSTSLTSKHCSLSSNARSARAICDLAFVTFDDYAGLDDHNGRDHTRW